MTRFFLHLQKAAVMIPDPEGEELDSIDAARREAIEAAREIMSAMVAVGRRPRDGAVIIADDAGHILMTVRFEDAFEWE